MPDKVFEFSLCLTNIWCYYKCTNTFKWIFSHKAYSKVDFGHIKISDAIFLGQSLLLSTTILNDIISIIILELS